MPNRGVLSGAKYAAVPHLAADVVEATGALQGTGYPSRFVGGCFLQAPTSGTWQTGDWAVDVSGQIWICVGGGTPGTWLNSSVVTSVAGRVGAITLSAADVGVGTFPNGTYNFNGTNIQLQGGTGSIVLQGTLTAVGTVNGHTDVQFNGGSLPRGRVASGQITSNFTATAANTEVIVTNLKATFTFVAGRRYKVTVFARIQNLGATAGSSSLNIRWAAGTTVAVTDTLLQGGQFTFPATASYNYTYSLSCEFTCVASGATGNQVNSGQDTLGVSVLIPSANSLVLGQTTAPAQIIIEDIGV